MRPDQIDTYVRRVMAAEKQLIRRAEGAVRCPGTARARRADPDHGGPDGASVGGA